MQVFICQLKNSKNFMIASKKFLTSGFILLLSFTCCKDKKTDSDTIIIDPKKAEAEVEDIIDGYYFVTLEAREENIIADIDKIEITDNRFDILDKKKEEINIFDKQGFYISQIAKKGRGPEEYLDIADFTISDNFIYILSRSGRNIIKYTQAGEFVKSYKLDDWYDFFYINGQDLYLYSNYSNNKLYNIITASINEDEVSFLNEFLPFPRNQSFSFQQSPFNKTGDNELLISQQYSYDIYNLNKENIFEEYRFEFLTKDEIPQDFEKEDFLKLYLDFAHKSVVTRISHINKSNDFIYIIYTFEYLNHLTKVDKTRAKVETLKLEFNDIYPFVFTSPLMFHNDYLVGYIHAVNALMFNEKFESDKNTDGLLKPEDNPVLFFHKLKSY